jgi:hypothetical protein
MKLFAGRDRDQADMVALWPHSGFTSAGEAVEAMYEAYPAAQIDPHLESFVELIIAESAG